jgi:hypothetical protein
VLHAPIQHTVFHVLEFRLQTTQDYKINRAAVLYMVIMMRCQHNKIVSHAHMNHVKLVQIAAPAKPALVIKVKTIHAFWLTALAQLASTLTQLYKQIAYVYLSLIFTIKTY